MRQGSGGKEHPDDDVDVLFKQAARSSADTAMAFGGGDAEDAVDALFDQAARSSGATVLAFSLDGEL